MMSTPDCLNSIDRSFEAANLELRALDAELGRISLAQQGLAPPSKLRGERSREGSAKLNG